MVWIMHVTIMLFLISGPALADYIKYDANELPDKADPAWERSGDLGSSKIIVDTQEYAKRMQGFAAMSGCTTELEGKDGHWVVYIKGGTCRCG